MSDLPPRASILMAWKNDREILTAREAMERAGTNDIHAFLGNADRGFLAKEPWRPHAANLWRITPSGWDERERQRAVKELIHG